MRSVEKDKHVGVRGKIQAVWSLQTPADSKAASRDMT